MGVRLSDTAVLLEPPTTADPGSGRPRIDWSGDLPDANKHQARFQAQPSVTGGAGGGAEEGSLMAQWRGYLGPEWDGIVRPSWRIRWHGEDYSIDGPVSAHRRGGTVRYLSLSFRRAKTAA